MALYTISADPDGNLYVAYLYRGERQWCGNWNWLDNYWDSRNSAARLATFYFVSNPLFRGIWFSCDSICLAQPPSILPTSSIWREMTIYFLLSRQRISQRIISITFNTSTLRMASITTLYLTNTL